MKNILATYHKDCIDGTTAAAVVLRKFPEAKLFPLAHSYTTEDLEPIFAELEEGTEVYTVDCGLGARELLAKGYRVTTIDHHIGGKEEFEALAKEYPQYTYVFDNEKSGASLSWSFFFPEEEIPELIKYVEDADLWSWKYGTDTQDVNGYLSMFRNDPLTMLTLMEGSLDEVKEKGKIISMYSDREIEKQIQIAPLTLRVGAYDVPAYNITVHESACGNILSESLDQAVVLFTIKGDEVKMSIRSKEHQNPSALQIAQILGGGGHRNASGASVPLDTFLKMRK